MRYLIGTIILLLGLVALLQSSGLIEDQNTKDTIGSGLVVAMGAALFVWRRRYWAWALALALVGLTDFVENQQWPMFEQHTPWEYVWPLFIIILGAQLLLNRRQKRTPKDTIVYPSPNSPSS